MVGHPGEAVPRDLPLLTQLPHLRLFRILRQRGGMAGQTNLRLGERRKGAGLNPLMTMSAFEFQISRMDLVIEGDRLRHRRFSLRENNKGDDAAEKKDTAGKKQPVSFEDSDHHIDSSQLWEGSLRGAL